MSNKSIDTKVINGIVERVFGKGYSGTTKVEMEEDYPLDITRYEIENLKVISKETFFGGVKVKGLLNWDGSEITIGFGKRDKEKAEEYAGMYRKTYGTDVKIIQVEEIIIH